MPRLNARHVIAIVSYRAETIECRCGAIVTSTPDLIDHDRHEPLVNAWTLHRQSDRVIGRPGRKVSAYVYEGEIEDGQGPETP